VSCCARLNRGCVRAHTPCKVRLDSMPCDRP
jgi:hypothetical protein